MCVKILKIQIMKKLLILFTLITISYFANSQNFDSLINIVNTTDEDSIKFETLLRISDTYYSIDDSLKFEDYKNQALELLNSNDELQTLDSYIILYSYFEKFNTDLSIFYQEKAFEKAKDIEDYEKYCSIGNLLGYYYSMIGDNQKSIEILLNVLKTIEEKKLYQFYQSTFMFLGFTYRNMEKLEKSLEYFKKSLEYSDTVANYLYFHVTLNEIGNIFNTQGNLDSALFYHKKALKIRENGADTIYLSYSYNDIAADYKDILDYETALFYYKKCIEINKSNSDTWGLSITYGNIAQCYIEINDMENAKSYLDSAEFNAIVINMKPIYHNLYSVKYEFFEKQNDFKNALENYKLHIIYRDSIFEEESNNQILELEAKFESEKKDKELIKAKESEKRKNTIIYSFIVIIIISLISLILIFRLLILKKHAYNLLIDKNEEINQQKEEIQTQRDEIEERNFQLVEKNEKIEKQQVNILQSITYASRIQKALLPSFKILNDIFPENLIFLKPRDIVSGDFYYCKKINDLIIIAAADCTGHGVPGAFMSMLGITLLNEIVRYSEIKSSSEVLNELRNQIKVALRQTGQQGEQQDGMDIAFCAVNSKTLEMSFAGAHNPCWIFRKELRVKSEELIVKSEKLVLKNDKIAENELFTFHFSLFILEADRQPVGIFIKEKPFTENKFQLQKDDVFYIFSDGFSDQFGGKSNEKFKTARFKILLQEINQKTFSEQKQILENKFNDWRGDIEQTDDVLVIGIKI